MFRAHTFWMAFTCDRLAAACTGAFALNPSARLAYWWSSFFTGWASSLAEEECSTLLPKPEIIPGPIQPIQPVEMEQLSLNSPTFFTSNATPLVGAANLHFKSVVLLGRVCAFLRSSPWPIGADIVKGAKTLQHRGGARSLDSIPTTLVIWLFHFCS